MDVETRPVDADPEDVDPGGGDLSCQGPDPGPFCGIRSVDRVGAPEPGPHLDRHPLAPVHCEEIDLPSGDDQVGGDHLETTLLQVPPRQGLADGAQLMT